MYYIVYAWDISWLFNIRKNSKDNIDNIRKNSEFRLTYLSCATDFISGWLSYAIVTHNGHASVYVPGIANFFSSTEAKLSHNDMQTAGWNGKIPIWSRFLRHLRSDLTRSLLNLKKEICAKKNVLKPALGVLVCLWHGANSRPFYIRHSDYKLSACKKKDIYRLQYKSLNNEHHFIIFTIC